MKKPDLSWVLVGLLATTTAMMAGVMAFSLAEPPKLSWTAVSVENSGPEAIRITAETIRRDAKGCSNGVQADLRSGETVRRLAAPVRTISGHQSVYEVSLDGLRPGRYQVQLREVFSCGGPPEVISAPWLSFSAAQ